MRALVFGLALSITATAVAKDPTPTEVWKTDRDRATVTKPQISMPVRAGTLSLIKTGEASENGKGIDNIAQYESEDGEVFGTVYIFYPTYADTALATYATDAAIRERFGKDPTIALDTVVPVAGIADGGIKRIYDNVALAPGKPLVTLAGFVRADSWMVVTRVTAPASRRAEADAAFDTLVAGLRFDGKAKPVPAMPLKMAAACPETSANRAKPLADKNQAGMALLASLIGGSIVLEDKKGAKKGTASEERSLPAFPNNGRSALCVSGATKDGHAILRPASSADGDVAIILLNDAGRMITAEPVLFGKGYTIKRYDIAQVEVFGSFETMPNNAQLSAMLDGSDKDGGKRRSRTVFTTDGNTSIEINSDALK